MATEGRTRTWRSFAFSKSNYIFEATCCCTSCWRWRPQWCYQVFYFIYITFDFDFFWFLQLNIKFNQRNYINIVRLCLRLGKRKKNKNFRKFESFKLRYFGARNFEIRLFWFVLWKPEPTISDALNTFKTQKKVWYMRSKSLGFNPSYPSYCNK